MPGIVEFPQVVREALETYGDLFANEPERRHFAEYLTGLMIADRKTVNGINAEFAQTTDQSCLNRFLTEVEWDEQALNEKRLAGTAKGFQHPVQRPGRHRHRRRADRPRRPNDRRRGLLLGPRRTTNKIAHDYMFANYVCPSGKHYPLEFRRFKKRAQCEATGETFEDHTKLFCQLIDWVCEHGIPGDFTFDSYFTNAENLNHIHAKKDRFDRPRGYVGDLKQNRKIEWKGKIWSATEIAASWTP